MTSFPGRRFVRGVPPRIKPGRILCHNQVVHGMLGGMNGFRAWTCTEIPKGFIKCPCGFGGIQHYAIPIHVKWQRKHQRFTPSQRLAEYKRLVRQVRSRRAAAP